MSRYQPSTEILCICPSALKMSTCHHGQTASEFTVSPLMMLRHAPNCREQKEAAQITCQLHRVLVSTCHMPAAHCYGQADDERRRNRTSSAVCPLPRALIQRSRECESQTACEPESQRARGSSKKVAVEPAWAIVWLRALQPQLPKVAI